MKYKDLNAWQKKRLLKMLIGYIAVTLVFLGYFLSVINGERVHARDNWDANLKDKPELAATVQEASKDATQVICGTYVENIREINMKSSYYRAELQVWFKWEGDESLDMANNFRVYKGSINKLSVMKESHENGVNYQLVNLDVTVSKNFDAKRFPLESHQLRLYVESVYPVQQVVLKVDREDSGLNPNLAITGYKFLRHDVGEVSFEYDNNHGDPSIKDKVLNSEIVTAVEINRNGYGLYIKCFIALLGTLIWSFIALFLNSHHHVDPLGMLPGALFGAVGNIMVGAGLLPDALDSGLLEYVNIWGIITILGISIVIINVNRLRSKYNESPFAHFYGAVMFYVSLVIAVAGNILMPVMSYIK